MTPEPDADASPEAASPATDGSGETPPPEAPPPPAAPSPGAIPVEVQADETGGDPPSHQVELHGHARLLTQDRELRADSVTANTLTRDVTATGHVRVTGDERRITGQSLTGNLGTQTLSVEGDVRYSAIMVTPNTNVGPRDLPVTVRARHLDYNFLQKLGSFADIETTLQGLHFRGKTGVLRPDGTITLTDAEFSACPLGEGGRFGYTIRARGVDYDPKTGAVARRASVYLGRHRVLSLSKYRLSGESDSGGGHLPLPAIGSSELSGAWLRLGFQPTLLGLLADTHVDLTTRIGIRGATMLRPQGGGPTPFLRLAFKEEVEGRDPKRLLIDRLPEFGLVVDDASRTRLSHYLRGEISYAYLQQHAPRRRTGRAQITLLTEPIALRKGFGWRPYARPGLHYAAYSNGESYRDASAEFYVDRRWDERRTARFGVVKHFASGTTPFRFDEALIPTEAYSRLRWSAGSWGFGLRTRHDLTNGRLFDMVVSLGKTVRCIQPSIAYSSRLKEFSFQVNLVGLTTLDRLPAANTLPRPSFNDPME